MADITYVIPKDVFIGTTSAFLGLCIITSAVRFYIRLRIKHELDWDDRFLTLGLCCVISGISMTFTLIDDIYSQNLDKFEGFGPSELDLDTLWSKSLRYRRMGTASVVLIWTSVCSVKFSFLALFRPLIRQMPVMIRYWWFTAVFNMLVAGFGVLVIVWGCPYYAKDQMIQAIQCIQGGGRLVLFANLSISSMVVDLFGDFFIVIIPVVLIWKIRIRWPQKIALALTLCLTIVMMALTAIRIAGVKAKGKMNLVWENYFIAIGAEIGMILVAVSAIRALYVSKTKHSRPMNTITTFNWYHKGKGALISVFSKSKEKTYSNSDDAGVKEHELVMKDIPHGTLTGMRTMISEVGTSDNSSVPKEEV